MKKSFAVFGIGRFGTSIANTLMSHGAQVLAIDSDPDVIKKISSQVTCAVSINVCDANAIKEVGLENIDAVIVAMGHSLEASVMTIMTAKELGVPFVMAKANSDEMAKIFLKVGADRVVFPEKDAGVHAARKLLFDSFIEYFEIDKNLGIAEIKAKPEWIGKTIKELDLRKKYKLNVIAVKNDNNMATEVNPDEILKENAILIVVLSNAQINKLM
ncbi:MAG: potassium channel family protein [Coprococcus sp.]